MAFKTSAIVRFAHVDAAGIVFYPRYFEIMNGATEDWCAAVLGIDFHTMHMVRKMGLPVVDISAAFVVPSRLGDVLDIAILPTAIGRSSCKFIANFRSRGEERLQMRLTNVWMNLTTSKSEPWPDDLRARIEAGIAERPAQ